MKTKYIKLFEDLYTDYDHHHDLSSVRSKVKEIKELLSNVYSDEDYTDLMMSIEEEFGDDVAYVIDNIEGQKVDIISEEIYGGQKGNQHINFNLFLTNFDQIKSYIQDRV